MKYRTQKRVSNLPGTAQQQQILKPAQNIIRKVYWETFQFLEFLFLKLQGFINKQKRSMQLTIKPTLQILDPKSELLLHVKSTGSSAVAWY